MRGQYCYFEYTDWPIREEHYYWPIKVQYLPGLTVRLLPLSSCWTEHLQTLDSSQHHWQPVAVLDILQISSSVSKYLAHSRLQTQVETHTLCSALLITAANTGEHTVICVSWSIATHLRYSVIVCRAVEDIINVCSTTLWTWVST